MRSIVRHYGINGILYFKLIAIAIMAAEIFFFKEKFMAGFRRVLIGLDIGMLLIVVWGAFCIWNWG
jgi:hypothetical protein